ncbi:hypothetical protein F2Q70_00026265, partial [Brassica cretica]
FSFSSPYPYPSSLFTRLLRNVSGDWGPNKDLKVPHVIKIGQFAVNEYNIHSKSEQKFVNIVRGEFQVVSGVNYMLVVEANDGIGTSQTKCTKPLYWSSRG